MDITTETYTESISFGLHLNRYVSVVNVTKVVETSEDKITTTKAERKIRTNYYLDDDYSHESDMIKQLIDKYWEIRK